jgi:hypothetical protein
MIKEKVKIKEVAREGDLYEFGIERNAHSFRISCYLYKMDEILLLNRVDVEGPGQNTIGKQVLQIITEICKEFCNMYKSERIIILGEKRTAGKTKGIFFNPIYKRFKN